MKLGTTELLIILLIVLILFGTRLIPRLHKAVRKSKQSFHDGLREDPSEEE